MKWFSRVGAPSTIRARIDRLPGRSRVYSTLVAAMSALLLAGLVIPFAAGDRLSTRGASGFDEVTGSAVPEAAVSGGQIVLGAPAGSGNPLSGAPGEATSQNGDSRPAAAGGTDAGAGPGAPRGPAPGRAPSGPDTTDQGVTATTLRIGVLVTDLGGTSALGFEPDGYSPADQRRFFQVHVDAINRQGGVAGRQLEVFYETVDILDPDTMRAACRTLGQDRKVFAVLHVLGVYGDPILCFTQQQKLPYIAWDGAVSDYYARSDGRLFTTQPSTLRTSLDMARRLEAIGELKGQKIGILRYAEYLDADMKALIGYTRELGHEVVDAVISVSNLSAVPGQLSVAVNRFQSEGVGQVFLMTNTLYGQQFVAQAERQQYFPDYSVSDFDYTTAGHGFLEDMPDSFFRRAHVVTSTVVGEERRGREDPAAARCAAVAEAALKQDLSPANEDYYDYVAPCGLLEVLRRGLTANPTRAGLSATLQKSGRFSNPGFGPSSFGPSKFGAPDVVRTARADLACRCWVPVEDFSATGFRGS